MPLSKDPEKAARQLANLQKGRERAAEKARSLTVLPYAESSPPAPAPSSAPTVFDDIDDDAGSGLWIMLAAGVLLLVVLVVLSRRGARDEF